MSLAPPARTAGVHGAQLRRAALTTLLGQAVYGALLGGLAQIQGGFG